MSDTEKEETTSRQPEVQNISKEIPNFSPSTDDRYATLMETSGEECESWYYFIKFNGNETNLRRLHRIFESIDWYVLDDLSTFDLETDYLVSAETAKDMTKLDLNHTSHHRKFHGTLKRVDIKFKKNDTNEKKMARIFDVLGYGQIEDYVDQEDLDVDDLTENSSSEEEKDSSAPIEENSASSDEEEDEVKEKPKVRKGIPPALLNNKLPRYAKAKQHRRKKKH